MEGPICLPVEPEFRLIETMLWTPGSGIARRDLHLARLAQSARRFGIAPDPVIPLLDAITGEGPQRLRLTLDGQGRAALTVTPHAELREGTVWTLQVSDRRLTSNDPYLGVKTTRRELYDVTRAHLAADVNEVIFQNERGEICEGTITNIFADFGTGLVTPPLACGLLPGVLRSSLLASGRVREGVIHAEDLPNAEAIFVGNSLRGLISAQLS